MEAHELKALLSRGDIVPPTLATELLQVVDTLPSEVVASLGKLILEARQADREFGKASQAYLIRIQDIEEQLLVRVSDEQARIMQEFERQLFGSLSKNP
jgi:hypothetical protein